MLLNGSFVFLDKKSQKIHYLDTGSYDDFPELVECYIKMAHIFIVVLDYSSKRTYLSARRIVRDIRSVRGKGGQLNLSIGTPETVIIYQFTYFIIHYTFYSLRKSLPLCKLISLC